MLDITSLSYDFISDCHRPHLFILVSSNLLNLCRASPLTAAPPPVWASPRKLVALKRIDVHRLSDVFQRRCAEIAHLEIGPEDARWGNPRPGLYPPTCAIRIAQAFGPRSLRPRQPKDWHKKMPIQLWATPKLKRSIRSNCCSTTRRWAQPTPSPEVRFLHSRPFIGSILKGTRGRQRSNRSSSPQLRRAEPARDRGWRRVHKTASGRASAKLSLSPKATSSRTPSPIVQ